MPPELLLYAPEDAVAGSEQLEAQHAQEKIEAELEMARAALQRLLEQKPLQLDQRIDPAAQRAVHLTMVEFRRMQLEALSRGLNPSEYERETYFQPKIAPQEQTAQNMIVTPRYRVTPEGITEETHQKIVWRLKEKIPNEDLHLNGKRRVEFVSPEGPSVMYRDPRAKTQESLFKKIINRRAETA